ncbi:adenosine kinase [Prochlorococcus sp. MIT 1341]|uniref:adenosine kinase n=1 Tax=Prochlorococcus sp. MIT 1341 TaxID=3096221 RepID=UPI002A74D3D7|nr:adenosine kinase [Prochlorococcus sp. MIT 1341]
MDRPLDVVGIGNAIVDVLVQTTDNFLETHNLIKGSMTLVDEVEAQKLYQESGPGIETSGGSAANTIAGIAILGGKSSFIGRVRDDQLGKIFLHDIRSVGANFETPFSRKGPGTARCLILVTPDAQRTMCTHLGVSVQLEPEDLDLSIIKDSKVVYLEGYLWDNDAAKRAFIAAAKTSQESGGHVALSLSDSFCVHRHRESFLELVNNHIDILFANEDEITSLFKSSNIESAIKELKKCCNIAIVTRGEAGSIVLEGENLYEISAFKIGKLIDTTGAGDLYAGGFLYAYTQGKPLQECGEIGSICAGRIVTQLGSRSQTSLKELLRRYNKIK